MKTKSSFLLGLAVLTTGLVALIPTRASAVNVSLELALVVDESGSINNTEWELQRDGYVNAFKNPAIQTAIIDSGGIAVTYIQFDADTNQGIGWTLLNDVASINLFADAIDGLARFGDRGTGVAGAIRFAASLFGTEVGLTDNGFTSTRQIIDVSGDGRENQSGNQNNVITDQVTDAAIAAGIDRVNGIVISPNGEAGLLTFYQTQVQDGPDSFTLVADDFDDFEDAIDKKIFAEVTNQPPSVPEGGSSIVLGMVAIACLAGAKARRSGTRQ
ncbi:MAG: DUF1194 domain-containing protein [Verrucomicrobiales bacterium]